MTQTTPTTDVTACFPGARSRGLHILLKRDDLLHPVVSGNKWRKLAGLSAMIQPGDSLASMGGPWSNHLHALAWLCRAWSVEATLYVRGHGPDTPTLSDCKRWGANIVRVDRTTYRSLRERGPTSRPTWWLPEGGTGPWNRQGGRTLAAELPACDWLVMAVGSGGTLASVLPYLRNNMRVLGVAIGAPASILRRTCGQTLKSHKARCVIQDWSADPGFGKIVPAILELLESLWSKHELLLDPVYTAKLWLAVSHELEKGTFQPGQRVVLLHSGGVQGIRGLASRAPWVMDAYRHWLQNDVSFLHHQPCVMTTINANRTTQGIEFS